MSLINFNALTPCDTQARVVEDNRIRADEAKAKEESRRRAHEQAEQRRRAAEVEERRAREEKARRAEEQRAQRKADEARRKVRAAWQRVCKRSRVPQGHSDESKLVPYKTVCHFISILCNVSDVRFPLPTDVM